MIRLCTLLFIATSAVAVPPDLPPGNPMEAPIPAGGVQPPLEVYIPTLIEALGDEDAEVRQNLASALANTGRVAVDPLIIVLSDANRDKRSAAAYALGLIGTDAEAALPMLVRALQDDDKRVRRQVALAIARITKPNRRVILVPTPTPMPMPMPGPFPPIDPVRVMP